MLSTMPRQFVEITRSGVRVVYQRANVQAQDHKASGNRNSLLLVLAFYKVLNVNVGELSCKKKTFVPIVVQEWNSKRNKKKVDSL